MAFIEVTLNSSGSKTLVSVEHIVQVIPDGEMTAIMAAVHSKSSGDSPLRPHMILVRESYVQIADVLRRLNRNIQSA